MSKWSAAYGPGWLAGFLKVGGRINQHQMPRQLIPTAINIFLWKFLKQYTNARPNRMLTAIYEKKLFEMSFIIICPILKIYDIDNIIMGLSPR